MFKPTISLETFVHSPFGMDWRARGLLLFPVQLVLFKLMTGEPLNEMEYHISIPSDPCDPKAGSKMFTEQGFHDYLVAEGRLHPSQGIPKHTVLFGGRRLGKTTLLIQKALYDTTTALACANFKAVWPDPNRVATFCMETSLPVEIGKLLNAEKDKLWLKSLETSTTNSSWYFKRANPDVREVRLQMAKNLHSGRGLSVHALYTDELYWRPHPYTPNLQYPYLERSFVASSSMGSDEDRGLYLETKNDPDSLGICLHTWEVNPLISSDYYSKEKKNSTLDAYQAHSNLWS